MHADLVVSSYTQLSWVCRSQSSRSAVPSVLPCTEGDTYWLYVSRYFVLNEVDEDMSAVP